MLTIGVVTGVHGLKGRVRVKSFATDTLAFSRGKEFFLEKEDNGFNAVSKGFSSAKKGLLLSLEGVDTPEAAQELVGYTILIEKDQLPPLEEDTWYWQDLYGLEVVDAQRGSLGEITSIIETGASDVLVVQDTASKSETLIPMNAKFVLSVDMDAGLIHTDLPEGL